MSLTEYFEQHEEQAFVAKTQATSLIIILVKQYLAGLIFFSSSSPSPPPWSASSASTPWSWWRVVPSSPTGATTCRPP